MKIALINKTFTRTGGGAELYAAQLATELAARGHEVDMVGVRHDGLPPGARWHGVDAPGWPAWRRVAAFDARAGAVAAGLKADVVHSLTQCGRCDSYFMGGGVQRQWLEYRCPRAWQRTLRLATHPVDVAHLRADRAVLGKGRALIVANSKLAAGHAHRWHPACTERTRVVYHGVDHERFKPDAATRAFTRLRLGLNEGHRLLIFAAHNWRRKGLATVIRAMGTARRAGRPWKLVVVGRGDAASFAPLIRREGLGHDVIFLGSIAHVEAHYNAADVFVLPTMYDPFAVVTLEAMACGLPVVTTPANGAAEVVEDGDGGFILRGAEDDEGLAAALDRLNDADVRQRMSGRAAQIAAAFTWPRHVTELLRVLEEAAARRR